MQDIEIMYQGDLPGDKVVLPKTADIDCEEYRRFLPIMQKFIEKHKWKFASSMPECPHFYVCRDWLKDLDEIVEFNNVSRFIQKYGYDKKWFSITPRYLHVGMYKYWTMGRHWQKTIIINRAKIDG